VQSLAINGSTICAGTLWSGMWIRPLLEVTGIEEITEQFPAKIFPNPFSSLTTIAFTKEQKNATIKITDMFGKEMKTIHFSGKQISIERENLPAGVYLIQLLGEDEKNSYSKIVVQ
jgi:hypothetical protein